MTKEQAREQRYRILGQMTEIEQADRDRIMGVHAELKAVVDKDIDAGKLAIILLALDMRLALED